MLKNMNALSCKLVAVTQQFREGLHEGRAREGSQVHASESRGLGLQMYNCAKLSLALVGPQVSYP